MTETPRRILVVDDDDDYADTVVAFLEAQGHEVTRARSGGEGVTLARLVRPHLVLMDVMMEERTAGFFAIQEIRRDPDLAGTRVLVVSSIYAAIPGFRVSPEADWLRHDGFLAKPVDLDELLARVRELTAAPALVGAAAAEVAR
jgi:two-component system, chemotaxis family, chemotaxis protein CheY